MFLRALIIMLFASPLAAEPRFWQNVWETDFSIRSIESWVEIQSGGPGKDGIPAIDAPSFVAADAAEGLVAREPVITVVIEGEARAYPLKYLMWHEIVNDEIAGQPISVTFCPLCNSAPVFDRRTDAGVLSFGVSGMLRNSDMIMYDRETESWWQQAIGESVVGTLTGLKLRQIPSWMESWAQFQAAHPEGLVMAEPDFPRPYGRNPYVNYDSSQRPFLYSGENPPHGIPALMRVVAVEGVAWTLEKIARDGEIVDGGLTITWTGTQASALDSAQIADGKEVVSIRVKNAAGEDVPHDVMFAFAFQAFYPEGQWRY